MQQKRRLWQSSNSKEYSRPRSRSVFGFCPSQSFHSASAAMNAKMFFSRLWIALEYRTHARTRAHARTHTHTLTLTHTHTHTHTKTKTKNSIWRITRRLAQINKFSGWLKATGLKKEKRKISLKSMFRSVAESTSVKLLRHSARSLNSGYLTNRTWLL